MHRRTSTHFRSGIIAVLLALAPDPVAARSPALGAAARDALPRLQAAITAPLSDAPAGMLEYIKELTARDAENRRIAFRVGINVGDVIVGPHDVWRRRKYCGTA